MNTRTNEDHEQENTALIQCFIAQVHGADARDRALEEPVPRRRHGGAGHARRQDPQEARPQRERDDRPATGRIIFNVLTCGSTREGSVNPHWVSLKAHLVRGLIMLHT